MERNDYDGVANQSQEAVAVLQRETNMRLVLGDLHYERIRKDEWNRRAITAEAEVGRLRETVNDAMELQKQYYAEVARLRKVLTTVWECCQLAADIGNPPPLPGFVIRDVVAALGDI